MRSVTGGKGPVFESSNETINPGRWEFTRYYDGGIP